MGKPYGSELKLLPETYSWAMQADVGPLADVLSACLSLPLIAVGSGGSLTAAHFAVALHQGQVGAVARAMTPLEIVSSPPNAKRFAALFLSARGRNVDIVNALGQIAAREPSRSIVMGFDAESPLAKLADTYRCVDSIHFRPPSEKDGFLATNSLLAFAVLLSRAYARALGGGDDLPSELQALLHPHQTDAQFAAELHRRCLPLWERETLVVLHGTFSSPAATDIESKFVEAALGTALISDYRNFAHGRHHWLAKRGGSTSVLALVTEQDRQLADRTLQLLPPDIPVARLDIPLTGAAASLAAIVNALHVVGLAGVARGIDPGRPGVPCFGRKIYHLRALGELSPRQEVLHPREAVAIERKAAMSIDTLTKLGQLGFWRDAYQAFVGRIESASFAALVVDYDGTLCDSRDRYTGPGDDVVRQLARLLTAGITVGIATGRGKSAREDLRRKIDIGLWPRVMVGYYNGAEIAPLTEDNCPSQDSAPNPDLRQLAELLRSDVRMNRTSRCTYRRMQITVEPVSPAEEAITWEMIQHVVQSHGMGCLRVLRSSHSIDILAPGVTKRSLVTDIERLLGIDEAALVLCIGDRGRWPGNDFALLSGPYSLSVDDVSPDPTTCWNLASPGYRGVQATLEYLSQLVVLRSGKVRLKLGWRARP